MTEIPEDILPDGCEVVTDKTFDPSDISDQDLVDVDLSNLSNRYSGDERSERSFLAISSCSSDSSHFVPPHVSNNPSDTRWPILQWVHNTHELTNIFPFSAMVVARNIANVAKSNQMIRTKRGKTRNLAKVLKMKTNYLYGEVYDWKWVWIEFHVGRQFVLREEHSIIFYSKTIRLSIRLKTMKL